jgi:sugar (pentulose or hexulose) kinase
MTGRIAVLDIGKTNLKVALVDADTLAEVAVRRAPNTPAPDGPYPHADVAAQWDFFLSALRELARDEAIAAVTVAAHGATAALVDAAGELALPVLDYEHHGPEEVAAAYDAARPPFAETGSPRLPDGQNVGAQLFWLERRFPDAFARARHLLMWPQYFAFRLSGVAALDATSLGAHTDLWAVHEGRPSSLVRARGWERLLPPLRRPFDRLGPIRPELAARTGLAAGTAVFAGIHDSNASLLPHLLGRAAPFAVVSTGTWVISMAVGADGRALDPARDLLVNVNAFGDPVPSARFIGGREYEIVRAGRAFVPTDDGRRALLAGGPLLLPSVCRGFGPFPDATMRWTAPPATEGEAAVALAWYLALMTATGLGLVGARGPTVVEGPFARNGDFLLMLATATGRPVLAAAGEASGTAAGAALLARGAADLPSRAEREIRPDPDLAPYAARWRDAAAAHSGEEPAGP